MKIKTTKLNISLFRFNCKTDYLPYYKKYILEIESGNCVYDLFEQINDIDEFGFENKLDCYVNINGFYLNANTCIDEVISKCGNDLIVEPISKYRAKYDLIIDTQDFMDKLNILDKFITNDEKIEYSKKYILEYYSSNTINIKRDYIGDHILLIAYKLIKNNIKYSDEIINILKNKSNGIWYHTFVKDKILNQNIAHKKVFDELFELCNIDINKDSNVYNEDTFTANVTQSFLNFNITARMLNKNASFKYLIKTSDAKLIEHTNSNNDLALCSLNVDSEFTYKIAGEILLEAKDANADFMIVCSNEEFDIFDKHQINIQNTMGREINLPIITKDQFVMILEGEKDIKILGLDKHKIKVSFLDY